MNLNDAEDMARRLIAQHAPGYRFAWDNARSRFGQCNYSTRTISLSRPVSRINDETEVRDTILHECAHAIAGPSAGHGPVWRATARSIGARPNRTSDADNGRGEAPWVGVCAKGHVGSTRFFRRPRVRRSCATCAPGVFDSRYLLTYSKVASVAGMR